MESPLQPSRFAPGLRVIVTSLTLIVVAACAIRLAFAWDYQAHAPHRALAAIPFLFESGNIAVSLAHGHGFGSPLRLDTGPTAWTTPVYPLLLAGIMRVLGVYTFPSWVAAVLMNIAFSSLVCVPLYFAGIRIGGRTLGATAAWLWAIFPNAILLSYQSLWETSLAALLGATALWATLRLAGSARLRDWMAYGFLWGIILMTNAAMLSLLPIFLGWVAWRNWKASLPVLRNAAFAAGIIVLCCVPWTLRNYLVFHSLVPLRSALGLQLWVGNNPDAKVIWLGGQHPINDNVERSRYIEMGEIAYMTQKRRDAVDYILTHPSREAELIAGRFVMFWSGGTPHPLDDFLKNRSAWFRYTLLFNLALSLSALAGLLLLLRRHSIFLIPLAAGPFIFPLAYYLTLALPRYRHPIDPVLVLLTAAIFKSQLPS